MGERAYEPAALTGTETYQLGMGEMRLDLTGADYSAEGVETVNAVVGMGELNLVVPEGVRLTVNASGRAGEILAHDSNEGGASTSRSGTILDETFTYGPETPRSRSSSTPRWALDRSRSRQEQASERE